MSITAFIIVSVIKIVIALVVLLTAVAYTVWLERKVVGHMQNRWGPTRVGPFGLLQPLADGVKFHLQRRSDAAARVQAAVYRGAHDRGDFCPDLDLGRFPSAIGSRSAASQRRCEITDVNIGLADHSGHHFAGCVRGRAGGLVLQQQVLAAGRTAGQRADGQLRNFAGPLAGGRADSGGQLQFAGHRGCAGRNVLGIYSALEYFSWGRFVRSLFI